MLAAVFVSLSFSDVFGDLFDDDDPGTENVADPNRDVIAEQQTVVAENPENVEEILLLANLLGNSDRLPEAIPLYERAIDLAPDDVGVRVGFARALADGSMHADAELQFQRALEIDPDNQQAHYYLAEMLVSLPTPREAEAIEHYRRAAEIDPGTLIGERAQTQLDTLGAGTPAASPAADSPASPEPSS
jgi:cytochrome c-type biogenesis protein CcmH/NrfG